MSRRSWSSGFGIATEYLEARVEERLDDLGRLAAELVFFERNELLLDGGGVGDLVGWPLGSDIKDV